MPYENVQYQSDVFYVRELKHVSRTVKAILMTLVWDSILLRKVTAVSQDCVENAALLPQAYALGIEIVWPAYPKQFPSLQGPAKTKV